MRNRRKGKYRVSAIIGKKSKQIVKYTRFRQEKKNTARHRKLEIIRRYIIEKTSPVKREKRRYALKFVSRESKKKYMWLDLLEMGCRGHVDTRPTCSIAMCRSYA